MQRYKTKQINKYIPIIVIYFVVVAIRFLLALATSVYPTIGIDEFLYYSLARSIATKGELLFRGQPADYSYILYPLVLSPIYLVFKEGVNYYRLIQLWNIIIMSLSVFPVYGLSRLMLKNEKESLIVASLFMVLPDFILGQIIFSEAIIYPLFFALMYAAYCCIEKPRFKYLIYIGLLGGLLYSAKPGAVLPAVIFLVYVLAQALINKNRRQVIATFAGMAVLCVVPLAFLVLAKYCFGYSGSGFSVYNSQIGTELGWHLEKFFKFLAIYPYYFLLSCGVVGVAYPITRYKRWNSVQKAFWWFIIVCIIGMIIGTCWTVNRYEYRTNRAHLRYVAMYIPLMLLFCLLPEMSREKSSKKEIKKNKMPIILLMLYIVGCTLIWGCKAGAESEIYPLMSLCILLDRFMPASAQWWGNVAVILLCAALFIWLTRAENKKQKQYSAMILVGIMRPFSMTLFFDRFFLVSNNSRGLWGFCFRHHLGGSRNRLLCRHHRHTYTYY